MNLCLIYGLMIFLERSCPLTGYSLIQNGLKMIIFLI